MGTASVRSYALRMLAQEKVRFVLVGVWNTLFGFLVFLVVNHLSGPGADIIGVLLKSYAVSLPIAFALQRFLVFGAGSGLAADFIRFAASNSVLFALNLVSVPAAVQLASIPPPIAQAAFAMLFAVASYFVHKYFSFARGRGRRVPSD